MDPREAGRDLYNTEEHAMSNRGCAVALILLAFTLGSTAPAAAQSGFDPPRLADGRPDLQGSGTSAR